MTEFVSELRRALRQLKTSPGFTAAVVITLALGIGANTAIFSIVNALLLESLPYDHPERIAIVFARTTGTESSAERRNIDGEQWELLRDNVPSLISAVFSRRTSGVNLESSSHAQYVQEGRISAHYFDVLAIHPLVGRGFTEDEDRLHGPRAVVLSYSLWRTAFDGRRDALGRAILLKGEPFTVVGVLPDNAVTPLNADLYTALQASREGEGQATNFGAIMRLRDGANWQQADAEINRAWARSARFLRFQASNPGARMTYYCVPLQKGETDPLRPQALALMMAAGFILLIACANLAGLTMVRVFRRTSEIATRMALGASHWQILRQLWVENLVLAVAAGVAGVGVGYVALRGLLLLLPERFLPVATVSLDSRVLAFTLALSLLTSILFGMLPALITRKVDLQSWISHRSVIGSGGLRLRQGLITLEITLTVVLLAASGLLIRTLIHLETMPPGFNPNGVTTAKASLDDVRYQDPAAFRTLLNRSLAAMRRIPGGQDAAVGLTLPYERALLSAVTLSDGKNAGREITTNEIYVTPGYIETLQIPLLAGRAFTDTDGPDTQPVVIVNQTFVRKFFAGVNPVGRSLDKRMLIVGVVADAVVSSAAKLNEGSAPLTSEETIYVPAAQITDANGLAMMLTWFQPSWIVRTSRPVEGLTAQMQRALASAAPDLPFSGVYSMNDLQAKTLAMQRVEVALLSTMAMLALVLSAVGIFALVANMVAQRTREIGLRVALGSTIFQAMTEIGRSGVLASAAGIVLGLGLCAAALRTMRSVLYGVGVYDPWTLATVVLGLILVTMFATIVPALKIAKIDPAITLRQE